MHWKNSRFDEDTNKFDPKAEEERYYADCDEALNDNEIVGCVAAEPTYEDDDYVGGDHINPMFDDIQKGWPDGGHMPHEKMELEGGYFTSIDFSGNTLGYNIDTRIMYLEVARERARRPTSNAPSNRSPASLQVVVKRVSLLLNKANDFTPLLLHTFWKIEIHSYRQLYKALRDTQDNQALAVAFKR